MLKYAEETGAAFDNLKPSFEGEYLIQNYIRL